jgi:hypothetical protein
MTIDFNFDLHLKTRAETEAREQLERLAREEELAKTARDLAAGVNKYYGDRSIDNIDITTTLNQVILSHTNSKEKKLKITVLGTDSFSIDRFPKTTNTTIKAITERELDRSGLMNSIAEWSNK